MYLSTFWWGTALRFDRPLTQLLEVDVTNLQTHMLQKIRRFMTTLAAEERTAVASDVRSDLVCVLKALKDIK